MTCAHLALRSFGRRSWTQFAPFGHYILLGRVAAYPDLSARTGLAPSAVHGTVRGLSLAPLYPTVPEAALRDENLYAILALFDAERSGQARERNIAQKKLAEYFQ